MSLYVIGEPRGDEKISPIGLRQPNSVAELRDVATTELQRREADALEGVGSGVLPERQVVRAIGYQQVDDDIAIGPGE